MTLTQKEKAVLYLEALIDDIRNEQVLDANINLSRQMSIISLNDTPMEYIDCDEYIVTVVYYKKRKD